MNLFHKNKLKRISRRSPGDLPEISRRSPGDLPRSPAAISRRFPEIAIWYRPPACALEVSHPSPVHRLRKSFCVSRIWHGFEAQAKRIRSATFYTAATPTLPPVRRHSTINLDLTAQEGEMCWPLTMSKDPGKILYKKIRHCELNRPSIIPRPLESYPRQRSYQSQTK